MTKPAPRMRAGEFKAKCLAVLDDVEASRREVIITKRGRPAARLVRLEAASKGPLDGLIVHQGDIVSPVDAGWDAVR